MARKVAITTRRKLLTDSWASDVEALETSIERMKADSPLADDCSVVFFEVAGDRQLHVNVTHEHATITAAGWSGPGNVPDGFVHNRRFQRRQSNQVIQHVRAMVFAARI